MKKDINFEASLDRLNMLVEKMEQGNLPLEDSLKCFEEGVGLIRQCQNALKKAEQKVKILIEKNNDNSDSDNDNEVNETLEDFDPNETE